MVFLRVLYAFTVIAVGMALIADGGVMIVIFALLALLLMEGVAGFVPTGMDGDCESEAPFRNVAVPRQLLRFTLEWMPNLVLESSADMPYFTDMRLVFEAIPGVCTEHDWLISDLDCIWLSSEGDDSWSPPDPRLASSRALVTGRELDEILRSHKIQFVWAVFSAVRVGSRPNPSDAPYADGNPDLWYGLPKPQLPEADLEIVCWDSTCCLLIGLSEEHAEMFRGTFPDVLDLDEQNRKRPARPRP